MQVIKDPHSFERNKTFYKSLVHMLNNQGSCLVLDCDTKCPFSYKIRTTFGVSSQLKCHILDVFNVSLDSYRDNKLYYALMLLSLYTKEEQLTYLLQDI